MAEGSGQGAKKTEELSVCQLIKSIEFPESDRFVFRFQLCTSCVTMSTLLNFLTPGFLKCEWVNDVVRIS